MSELDLDAIEARAEAATPGPWLVTTSPYRGGSDPNAQVNVSSDDFQVADDLEDTDAAFIARARADVPALVAEVRRLRAAVDAALAECDRTEAEFGPAPVGSAIHGIRRALTAADPTEEDK